MRVLIAYDGSQCADLMLDDLRNAGLPAESEVLILSVAEHWLPRPAATTEMSPARSRGHEMASELAERATAHLMPDFPSWSVLIEAATGSPASKIVQRAEEWNADLIALGSLGHSALERILIGSVSYKVANEAPARSESAAGEALVATTKSGSSSGTTAWRDPMLQ